MDLLNAVSFTKGCYIGQELTARTKHRGLVRKRVLPVAFSLHGEPRPLEALGDLSQDDIGDVQPGSRLVDETGSNVGELIGTDGNLGLAIMTLDYAQSGKPLDLRIAPPKGQEPSSDVIVKASPFAPDWFSAD